MVSRSTAETQSTERELFSVEVCLGPPDFDDCVCSRTVSVPSGLVPWLGPAWTHMDLCSACSACDQFEFGQLQNWMRIEASAGADESIRQEVWQLFGTVGRSIVSMFELTLANYSGLGPWSLLASC